MQYAVPLALMHMQMQDVVTPSRPHAYAYMHTCRKSEVKLPCHATKPINTRHVFRPSTWTNHLSILFSIFEWQVDPNGSYWLKRFWIVLKWTHIFSLMKLAIFVRFQSIHHLIAKPLYCMRVVWFSNHQCLILILVRSWIPGLVITVQLAFKALRN